MERKRHRRDVEDKHRRRDDDGEVFYTFRGIFKKTQNPENNYCIIIIIILNGSKQG